MGTTTALHWLSSLAVAPVAPTFRARLGAVPYVISAVMIFSALVFAWRLLPETKGKSLEEIEAPLTGRMPAVPPVAVGTLHRGRIHRAFLLPSGATSGP